MNATSSILACACRTHPKAGEWSLSALPPHRLVAPGGVSEKSNGSRAFQARQRPALRTVLPPVSSPARNFRLETVFPRNRSSSCQASTSNVGPAGSVGSNSNDEELQEQQVTKHLLEMARLKNLLPAFFLVVLGAWTGTGRCMTTVLAYYPAVVTVALVSGAISAASMLINDYFDWASGVDGINSPQKPLVSGQIQPTVVLLASLYLYTAILVAACLLDSLSLRSVIAASAGLTILYTPVLKRMTAVKNLVVAAIIAASPLAGALAAGADGQRLWTVMATCMFAFLGVVYREILMDINDEEGDRKGGIKTLPVIFGKKGAMIAGLALIVGATLLGWNCALTGNGMAYWMERLPVATPVLCWMLITAILAPVYAGAYKIFNSNFDKEAVAAGVESTMPQFALGMLLFAIRA